MQIQPRKHVIDHAGHAAPTRQHEPDHTDQESICPLEDLDHEEVGIDYLSEVCN